MKKTSIILASLFLFALAVAVMVVGAPDSSTATSGSSTLSTKPSGNGKGPGGTTDPGFTTASTSINSSGYLVVEFKELGITPGETVGYTFQADRAATYACAASGGGKKNKQALAAYDEVPASTVPESGTLTAKSNGTVTGGMVLSPPGPDTPNICPAGETLELANVAYAWPSLTDTTNGFSADLTGTCTNAAPCSSTFISGYPNALLP